jgi:hypothetical protein
MKRNWMVGIIGLAISALVLGWARQAAANADGNIQRLLEVTAPYMQQNRELTIKYTGNYGNCDHSDQLLLAGQSMSKALNIPLSAELDDANHHPIYSIEKNVGKLSKVSLQVIKLENSSSCYSVIRLISSGEDDFSQANQWYQKIEQQLAKLKINGQWNFMVKGIVASNDVQSEDSTRAIMNRILHTVDGKVVESYRDQGTVSLSLSAKQFKNFIKSGEHSINLQAALHRNSLTGEMKLTVATPIITAEY